MRGYVLVAPRRATTRRPVPLDADGQGVPYAVYGYGAQMVEVAVDPALGTVGCCDHRRPRCRPRDQPAARRRPDRGRHRAGPRPGADGGIPVPGRTENLHDYLIPTIGDVPPIESILIEVPDPEGPFGAKGLGEHVLIPTAPAILNAIRHATGRGSPGARPAAPGAGGDPRRGGRAMSDARTRPAAPARRGEDPLRRLPGDVLHRPRPGRRLRPLRQRAGRIVRCDPVTILEPSASRRAARWCPSPPRMGRRSGPRARRFVTGIGAGTTYPDYKPAPFIVSRRSRAPTWSPW
jgi:hypothetical protein